MSSARFRPDEVSWEDPRMPRVSEQQAISRWLILHQVFLFYGNGGRFSGEPVERWYAALEAANDLRLYIGGAGTEFSFDPVVRARGTQLFKARRLPFAVIADSPMLRMLGSTGRLLGMDLQIYSWSESDRPFRSLGVSPATVRELNNRLRRLRREIDDEVERRAWLESE